MSFSLKIDGTHQGDKNMSPRNSAARRNKNRNNPGLKLDGIQLAGIATVIIILASGIWLFVLTYKPAAKTNIKQWASAPKMTIDVKKQYFADVKMAKGGDFVIQLYPDKAPITVNSFELTKFR